MKLEKVLKHLTIDRKYFDMLEEHNYEEFIILAEVWIQLPQEVQYELLDRINKLTIYSNR